MIHFRLNLFLAIAAIAGCSACAAWQFTKGGYAPALLWLIGAFCAVLWLLHTVRIPVNALSSFLSSLEARDTTLRMPPSDDPQLTRMAGDMNRIAATYGRATHDREVRKLYYDRILRVITHEIRNSIAPVIALSTEFADHPDRYGSSDTAEVMTMIRDQSRDIKRFLDSYYELTHLPRPEKAPVDVGELLLRVRRLAASHAKQMGFDPGEIALRATAGLAFEADSPLLERALTNLIRNAIEAVASAPDPKIAVTATRSGGYVVFRVADNGPGLPEVVAANLFQPFLTTKEGGSGIGLCISAQIARLHGGDIIHEPSASGTVFALSVKA